MRYTPAALCLSLIAMVSASGTFGAAPSEPLDPRAKVLIAQGQASETAGQVDAAIDAYEAALAIQPGNVTVLVTLADATRRQGMQGKALHYYREALDREPDNQLAIAGEGATLVEKGAVEKARRNLARLQQLCGGSCAPAQTLAAAITKGPAPQVVTAEQVKSQPVVTN